MKEYEVRIYENITYSITVKANNEQEAKDTAFSLLGNTDDNVSIGKVE